MQGERIVRSWNTVADHSEYAIAVVDDVRTMGQRAGRGARYSLAGEDLGDRYTKQQNVANIFDGASDGKNSYAIGMMDQVQAVMKFDRNWANGIRLFDLRTAYSGIAYDPTDKTLWLTTQTSSAIEHRTLDGTLLGSFDTGLSQLVMQRSETPAMQEYADQHGAITLRDDASTKVRDGLTTLEEALRVTAHLE